ncbi:hypothetical protein [Blastococcus sp. Marseille-P5729]|uniref:hypothetical protein n=1 Tax=Blastococcus sp. Marseille-P5729 TaxID=2086582 RepID=UPI00131D4C90|nr:hypothetical protein [Blastococcus sp. Marseille-P5729]
MAVQQVTRVAICPSPPALLPGATGASTVVEIERLRECALQVVRWLSELGEPVLVLASGTPRQVDEGTRLSARAFGIGFESQLGARRDPARAVTPAEPGLLVAAYLLDGHPASARTLRDPDLATVQLPRHPARALLVMGGGSARRREGAPGHVDDRAMPYDDQLVARIARPDLDALSTPDLALADELLADLPAPLAVAARLLEGRTVRSRVDSYDAPYGVADIVARWWTDD